MRQKLNDGFVRAMFLITFFALVFGAAICVTKPYFLQQTKRVNTVNINTTSSR